MYIGPWQEYKLAKLIQHHQQQQQALVQTPLGQQRPGNRLRQSRPCLTDADDIASVTSSTRSGTSFKSAQSAPSQLRSGRVSAQSRLNDFYEHWDRNDRQTARGDVVADAGPQQTRRLPPRPRSSNGRPKAIAKKRPKATSGPSFEEERRARILHMKNLYGLGGGEVAVEFQAGPTIGLQSSASNATFSSISRVDSAATLRLVDGYVSAPTAASALVAVVATDTITPDFDRALMELQASMDVRDDAHHPELSMRRVEEDPLALSMTAESMGGSGGLIAWSKNLRPEDLSHDATLASFF